MPKARVLFDSHGYHDGEQTRHAFKDEIIDVPADELERGLELGSLEKVAGAKAEEPAKGKAAGGSRRPRGRGRQSKPAEPTEAPPAGAVDPDAPTTPAGAPAGDGKSDQDA